VRRFAFRLESLQRWRIAQRDKELAGLDRLLAERLRLQRREAELERSAVAASLYVRSRTDAQAAELHAADAYSRYAVRQRRLLKREDAELERRIAAQRALVLAAEQRVEALAQMREQQHSAWRQEMDKEQEALVAELVVARWRQRQ
jgi:vacuolar-type H+-ATPase subunit I/STV1